LLGLPLKLRAPGNSANFYEFSSPEQLGELKAIDGFFMSTLFEPLEKLEVFFEAGINSAREQGEKKPPTTR